MANRIDDFLTGVFLGIGLAAGGTSLYLAVHNSAFSAVAALACGVFFFVIARPRMFKAFSISERGLSIELAELQSDVRQLRILAEAFARFVYWHQISDGRWGGPGKHLQKEITKEVAFALKSMGMTDEDLNRIKKVQIPYIRFDYANDILRSAQPPPEGQKQLQEFAKSTINKGIGEEPPPEALEKALRDAGGWRPGHESMIARYQEYWDQSQQ